MRPLSIAAACAATFLGACLHPAVSPDAALPEHFEGGQATITAMPASPPAVPAVPAGAPPSGPVHNTFHYKTDAQPGSFDTWGEGHLDPAIKDRFAEGMRLDCPGPGTLHAETSVDPEGTQLRLAIYVGGPKAVAVSTTATVDAKIEKAGPCYVVVSVPSFSWDCTFRVRASFTPEVAVK